MYEKVWMEATLNRAATMLEGTVLMYLILVGNDPLDPEAPILAEIPMTEALRRIQ